MPGSNPREAQKISKINFEYFSPTLSQVCVQHHNELGWLVASLNCNHLGSCVKSLDYGAKRNADEMLGMTSNTQIKKNSATASSSISSKHCKLNKCAMNQKYFRGQNMQVNFLVMGTFTNLH